MCGVWYGMMSDSVWWCGDGAVLRRPEPSGNCPECRRCERHEGGGRREERGLHSVYSQGNQPPSVDNKGK